MQLRAFRNLGEVAVVAIAGETVQLLALLLEQEQLAQSL